MREFFRGGWLGLEHFAKSWCTHTELAIKVDRLSTGASRWSSPGHPSAAKTPFPSIDGNCRRRLDPDEPAALHGDVVAGGDVRPDFHFAIGPAAFQLIELLAIR
jgi:hypothetical protein